MKRIILATVAIMAIVNLTSCSKSGSSSSTPSPTANFSSTSVGGNTHAPATVDFDNSSSNAASYSWDFGDGATSTQRDASHKYTAAGSYTVKLTAIAGSKTAVKTQVISIQPAYTKVAVTKVRLSATTESSAFTAYLRMANFGNTELWRSGNFTVTPGSLPAEWSITTPYVFTNLSETYFIEFWKDGVVSDTRVARTAFMPSNLNLGTTAADSYPTTMIGLEGITLTLGWQ